MLKRISVVALTVTLLFGFSMTAFADIRADARKYYRTGMALLKEMPTAAYASTLLRGSRSG